MNLVTYSDQLFMAFMASLAVTIYMFTSSSKPGLLNPSNQANASDANRFNVSKVYVDTKDKDNDPYRSSTDGPNFKKVSLISTLVFFILFVLSAFVLS